MAGLLLGLAAGALGLRMWMSRAAEHRVAAEEIADFSRTRPKGNNFLVCPPGLCPNGANLPSPVFAMGWERLRDFWREAVASQPRVELVASDPDGRRLTYIQRSAILNFPDIITVEFLPIGKDRSTLAVASRSRYGVGDFGVNRRRVTAWMHLLLAMMRDDQRVAPAAEAIPAATIKVGGKEGPVR
jgi:uncharacterized protein (DUF1499 family)